MRSAEDLLQKVVDHYLTSSDFNGLRVDSGDFTAVELGLLQDLVSEGQLQVVSEEDFPNPSIRPWSSRRSVESQAQDLSRLDEQPVCLYPTPIALQDRSESGRWNDQPYRQALAAGAGQLDVVFFDTDVLEQYRNDPRYSYWFGDVEVHIGVSDDVYLDDEEPDRDKIGSVRVGFAYDMTTIDSDKVRRYTCSFFRDLADLTPSHQQRWKTWEIDPSQDVRPHHMWMQMMMGVWGDTIGPFQKILKELSAINELSRLIVGQNLFSTTDTPREWGWVIRCSTQEWHQFVLATDKLLSENLSHSALSAFGVPRNDDDDQPLGTLARLKILLTDKANVSDKVAEEILKPLREIRKQRQRPAHALVIPSTDPELAAVQRDLLAEIAEAVMKIRICFSKHPASAGWQANNLLEESWYTL